MSIATLDTGNGPRAFFESGLEAKPTPFQAIPLIDFSAMRGSDPAARAKVGQAVRKACTEVGFFYATDHGVAEATIADTFTMAQRFFSLPDEVKRALSVEHSDNNRGYTPLLGENTDPNGKGDLHEAFDYALDMDPDDPDLAKGLFGYAPNQWPDEATLPGFKAQILTYHAAVVAFAHDIFEAFALALDLPETYFKPMTDKPMSIARILHYPSQNGEIDEAQIGIGAHSDYECFTILCTDDVPALQVLNAAGEWIEAPPVKNAFIVNVGDMMSRWTNDYFQSTIHRAINRSGRERFSMPMFVGPNPDVEIAVLPSCQSPGNPPKYAPIQAGAYVEKRINETYAHRSED